MADTKYPTIRYQTLDKCFRNKYKRFYIDDLIDACSEAITNHCGKEIGCSRRTILNDIDFMESEAGWSIPLERYQDGRKVYYRYTNTDFTINETLLSESEYNKLNETISVLEKFKGMPCFEWMDELLFKLQRGFQKHSDTIIDFEHAPSLKGMNYLEKLFSSILYKQVIEVTYSTYNNKVFKWVIHPYLIKQYNNRWFLFGKNASRKGVISNIPLDRIDDISDLGIPYEKEDDSLQEMLDNIIGVTIVPKVTKDTIKLQFSESRFPYVVTKPLHKSQVIIDESERIMQIQVIPNKELVALILQFGSDVEILEPMPLRQQIKEKIIEMMNLY